MIFSAFACVRGAAHQAHNFHHGQPALGLADILFSRLVGKFQDLISKTRIPMGRRGAATCF